MDKAISEAIQSTVNALVGRLTNSLTEVIEARLGSFAQRFSEENGATVEQAFKKARRENHTCKRKENQQQLDHELEVLDKFDAATSALKNKSYDTVKAALEEGTGIVKSTSSGIKGRLSASIEFWKSTLSAPDFVLDTIRRGYRLPFAEFPPSCFPANNRSAFQHSEFVTQAISELLANGCIIEHSVPPFCANPLSVAKGKKLRLVIDVRHVNSFLVRITLEAQWIPRSQNERADLLSRFVDEDDWRLNPSVFRLLDAKWDPHTFDCLATHYNAQLPRFNTKFASPGCNGVDTLAQDWSAENNLICAPVSLIVDSVRHLMFCFGRGTLIIFEWPSAHFQPFLREGSSRFSSYVAEEFVLLAVEDLLLEGPVRSRSIILDLLFFVVARSSECSLCA
ncbi:hypothetical protein AWC38_SpisGene5942 [Stylophora pistillata]|uniref:Uncharacterized protein n=1 Tax=Stylophora pistillata TaxID=50429 RepID=A0A2B4SJL7_STYPI|nr:hypothetical protein AWC38_SpisGene5942 [Stylophora pistillata]